MRFPYSNAAVLDDWHSTMWVLCKECGCIEAAERATKLHVPMIQSQLTDQPHHLLYIQRASPAVDRQHCSIPSVEVFVHTGATSVAVARGRWAHEFWMQRIRI